MNLKLLYEYNVQGDGPGPVNLDAGGDTGDAEISDVPGMSSLKEPKSFACIFCVILKEMDQDQ
jgi:hypothetical protein